MPQTYYPYTSRRTGKTYETPWNKPTPPTKFDLDSLEKQILDKEEQELSSAPKEPEKRGFFGALKDVGKGVYDLAERVDRRHGTGDIFERAVPGMAAANEMFLEPAKKVGQAFKDEGMAAGTYEALEQVAPFRAIHDDWTKGDYGALPVDMGMALLSYAGVKSGVNKLRGKAPIVEPVPDVTPVTTQPKVPLQLTEVAGVDPRIPSNQGVRRPTPKLLNAVNPVEKPGFVAHPSGKVAKALDPNAPEAMAALDLQRPGTGLRDVDIRPNEYTDIQAKPVQNWNWDVNNPNRLPDPFNPTNVMEGGGKGKLKGPDRLMRNQGIGPRDAITPEGNIFSTVPNRLRPEAPNVTMLRNMAGEQPFTPAMTAAEAKSIARNKAKEVRQARSEAIKTERAAAKLAAKAEGAKPPKGSKLAESLTKVELLDQKVLDKFSELDDRIPSAPKVSRPKPVKPERPYNPNLVDTTVTKPGMSARELLDDAYKQAEATRKKGKPVEAIPRQGRNVILDNPTPDDIRLREGQGWTVKSRDGNQVTMKYEGVEPAAITGETGRLKYGKFMRNNPAFKGIMDQMIKVRSAGDLIGKGIRNQFAHVANIPKEKLVEFQSAMASGKHGDVRKFFDDLHSELRSKGIDVDHKENYLPQIWDNTAAEIKKAVGDKTLSEKASFQLQSVFDDYKRGIDAGLKPKMSPVELMEWYGKRANKLIADYTALKGLKEAGYLVEEGKRTPGMQAMDPNYGTFKDLYADPSVKKVIEGYLKSGEQQGGFISNVAKTTGKLANIALSSGVLPHVPLATYHGMNMAMPFSGRAFMEGGFKRNYQAVKYGIFPKKAAALLDKENPQMIQAAKEHGFKASVENAPGTQGSKFFENPGKNPIKGAVNWFTDKQHHYFENDLFNKMIPATKWEAWKDNFAKFKKQGMSEADAGREATKITDTFFSGKNVDLMYNNKNFNTATRILTMAPDWLRSTVDMGINIPKSMIPLLKDYNSPASKAYRKAGYRVLGAYVTASMLQKMHTGKFLHENSVADQFNFDTGEKDSNGNPVSVKLFGSSADAFKIPLQAAMATAKDNGGLEFLEGAAENRASPLSQLGLNIIKGEDYKGEPNIFSTRDRYGREIPTKDRLANTFSQMVNMGPPQISSPYNLATGRMSPEEAFSRVAELPLKIGRKSKGSNKLFNGLGGLGVPNKFGGSLRQ